MSNFAKDDAVRLRLRPGPIRFFHRGSPRPLESQAPWVRGLWRLGQTPLGKVSHDDAPLSTPGMTEVVLDPEGRLVELRAVPPAFGVVAVEERPDWGFLLEAAGFDPVELEDVTPAWTPSTMADERHAWEGAYLTVPESRCGSRRPRFEEGRCGSASSDHGSRPPAQGVGASSALTPR